MTVLLKNPDLPDYFRPIDGLDRDTPPELIASLVADYEAAKIMTFPDLKLDLDFDFWADLPADDYPGMKKMLCYVDSTDQGAMIDRALRKAQVPDAFREPLFTHMERLFSQIMPIYERLFAGYDFSVRRAVFRLNTIHSENLHFDTYKEEYPDQFARMFINLDNQPRIWHTSWRTDQIYEKFGHLVPAKKLRTVDVNRFWREMQIAAFGPGHPFDNQPRHALFFEPGDVWIVDSRQVSHQIFYGRRAVSIDFVVPRDRMLNPAKHYMAMAEAYRDELLGRLNGPATIEARPRISE